MLSVRQTTASFHNLDAIPRELADHRPCPESGVRNYALLMDRACPRSILSAVRSIRTSRISGVLKEWALTLPILAVACHSMLAQFGRGRREWMHARPRLAHREVVSTAPAPHPPATTPDPERDSLPLAESTPGSDARIMACKHRQHRHLHGVQFTRVAHPDSHSACCQFPRQAPTHGTCAESLDRALGSPTQRPPGAHPGQWQRHQAFASLPPPQAPDLVSSLSRASATSGVTYTSYHHRPADQAVRCCSIPSGWVSAARSRGERYIPAAAAARLRGACGLRPAGHPASIRAGL